MLGSLTSAVRCGRLGVSSTASNVSRTHSVANKAVKPQVQKRLVRTETYFHKYFPPSGIPSRPANEEPWDYLHRPKRRQGQLARKLERLIAMNDYYTLFKQETPEVVPRPPIEIPEARSTIYWPH